MVAPLVFALNPASAQAADIAPENVSQSWFHLERLPELVAVVLTVAAILIVGRLARRFLPALRVPAALRAIGDAVGRATETGTPVVYITGWGGDMGRPTTMASMAVLANVAGRCADYQCALRVPSHDPVVASVAEDTIHQAALLSGRPEWSRTAEVRFVTQSQFGYAAAVEGIFARERPGAAFLLGSFEGEALILAEAAYSSGAVTIAGTDSTIQLSFFLVACDYTLIGEELFAAPALLSDDHRQRGAVWAQDWLKHGILALVLAGVILRLATAVDLGPLLAQ